MAELAQIGVTGLAVMGRNLARNFARHGHALQSTIAAMPRLSRCSPRPDRRGRSFRPNPWPISSHRWSVRAGS